MTITAAAASANAPRRVMVTGAGGYLGRQVVAALDAAQRTSPVAVSCVLALDVRAMPAAQPAALRIGHHQAQCALARRGLPR